LFRKNEIKRLTNIILRYKQCGDIMEIGCGDGRLLNSLKESFAIRSMDISDSAVRRARQLLGCGVVEQKDIEVDELTGSYDLVIALNVLEHLKDPYAVLIKIRKVLKPDGIFLFSAPNNYGLYGALATRLMSVFDRTHISTLRREHWMNIFEELDFIPVEIINGTFFVLTRADIGKHFCSTIIIVFRLKNAM